MRIVQNLVPEAKYAVKCPNMMDPEWITIHNTANSASAQEEISYMISNDKETSFHFSVDEEEAVQGLPLNRNGWHSGDGNGNGNRKSIGIEIARSTSEDESLFDRAEQNTAQLVAQLLSERGWGVDRVRTHQSWSGKYCPHKTLDRGWDRFINMIRACMGEPQKDPVIEEPTLQSVTSVDIDYMVQTDDRWLPMVHNMEDFAGVIGHAITGVAMKVSTGSIKYRVHSGGRWLGYITDCNVDDYINGYAGNGEPIDAIEVYYTTPDDLVNASGYKKAIYKVSPVNCDYYSEQFDNETGNGMDGYAGAFGNPIDRLSIRIA